MSTVSGAPIWSSTGGTITGPLPSSWGAIGDVLDGALDVYSRIVEIDLQKELAERQWGNPGSETVGSEELPGVTSGPNGGSINPGWTSVGGVPVPDAVMWGAGLLGLVVLGTVTYKIID